MTHRDDEVWATLEGLRHSDVVQTTRRWAASPEARGGHGWRRLPKLAWPGAALSAAMAALAAFVLMPDQIIRTDVGEIRRVALADGTVVTLNTDTRLRVSLGENRREVALLSGQARFDVARDPSRPFTVAADGITVTALGTAFDVVALPRRTAVTLIEGKVLVQSEERRTVLSPGQRVALAPAGALTRPVPARLDAALAWQHRLVDLSDMTLADAIAEVNRYSGRKLRVDDPSLAQVRVSGVFRAGDVEAVAAALSAYFDLAITDRTNDRIVLGRRG